MANLGFTARIVASTEIILRDVGGELWNRNIKKKGKIYNCKID